MAEFWSNNDRGYRIRLWIDQVSQNIGGNSSQVRVRLALLNSTTTFAQYSCSAYVDLNGQRLNWSGSPSVLNYNQTIMLIDQTITIGHNADGTKSFGLMASFSGSGGWSPGTLTISGNSFTLSTIPRSSSISVGAGTIGSSVTINISRQSSSFKHTVRYAWGNKSGTIATNVDTSTTWIIPNDFANDIPNSTSGTGTIYVDTYNEGTKTGTQSVSFTASVPANMKPTFSGLALTDTNGVARGLLSGNNFLQIISNIQVNFNGASGSYGSSITGYKAELVNRNQVTNSNGGTLGIMNFNGSATIRASVFDSRGRQSDTRDITINVIEYFAPILSFSAVRTRETPNIIQIVRNAKIAPITLSGSQKNIMTLSFKVAPLGSSSFTADNGSASGSWTTQHAFVNSAANMSGNYVATKSFVVVGTLSDKFTSTEFSATVATESVVMSYDKDGRVGIGKVVERGIAGSLDVAGNIYAGGSLIQQHPLTTGNPTTGTIGRFSIDSPVSTGFGWGVISKYFPAFSANGVINTFFTSDKEATQLWYSHDGGAAFGRYRSYSNGLFGNFKAVGLDNFYPIGSIYQSTAPTNPSTFMGGTWQRFGQGRVLVGVSENEGEFNAPNKTGGAKTHTLTIDEMPSHSHRQVVTANEGNTAIRRDHSSDGGSSPYDQGINTGSAGGGQAHNNLQPYITVYMWQRIA